MGTKMGGSQYSEYQGFMQQTSLVEEDKVMNSEEFERRAELLVSSKLSTIKPHRREMKSLDQFAEQVQTDIGEKLFVAEKHLFGSSVKNTMVDSSHKKDVDILIVLDSEKHHDLLTAKSGSRMSLVEVRDVLRKNKRYKDAIITIDGNAVVIKQSGRIVDVVPAFRNPNGRGFIIPESNNKNSWIISDPRTSKRILDIEDKKYSGQVRPLIQLAKDWNERNGRKLKSYHIEAIVIQHFMIKNPDRTRSLHVNFDSFFYNFPDYLRSSQIKDLATDEKVGGYLSFSEKEEVIKSAIRSRSNIIKARAAKKQDEGEKSLRYYKKVLYNGGGN